MRSDLIEAYVGRREDELRAQYDDYVQLETNRAGGVVAVETYESWAEQAAIPMIEADSLKQRLEEYLHWNGIFGHTSATFAIATGEV